MRNDHGGRSGRKARMFFQGQDEGPGINIPSGLSWEPPADVVVTDGEVIVIVDIAGMERDSIDIVTDGSRLRIRGVRGASCCEGRKRYHQIEIRIGRFYREIELPVPVDHEKTAARYDRGMLEIRIARSDPESRTRKVEIE